MNSTASINDAHISFPGPINLGNPIEFTMIELAELVIKLTKSKSIISYQPLPTDHPTQRRPDISLARQYLKWEPVIQLEAGLIKTIDYFNNTLFN